MDNNSSSLHKGIIVAFSAYLMWGFLPIYWKQCAAVPPWELISWRLAGCGLVAWIVMLFRRRLVLKSVVTGKVIIQLAAAALFIGVNWGLYIWAVATNHMIEASLGYYINPLINVVMGIIFFSEKLGKIRLTALILALIGVILMTMASGSFPWISIVLAFSFGLYGLMTKMLPHEIESFEALAWEMVILGPLALAYLIFQGIQGNLHYIGYGSLNTSFLSLAGLVTLIPLWLFGIGAKRIPMGMLGFLQYIAPSIMLILGIFLYSEPFSLLKGLSFAFILTALGIYSSTLLKKH